MPAPTPADWFAVVTVYGALLLLGLGWLGYLLWRCAWDVRQNTTAIDRFLRTAEEALNAPAPVEPEPMFHQSPPFFDAYADPQTPGGREQAARGRVSPGRFPEDDPSTRTRVSWGAPSPLFPSADPHDDEERYDR